MWRIGGSTIGEKLPPGSSKTIRFIDKTHTGDSPCADPYKTCRIWRLWGPFFENGTKKSSFSTGFIRVWAWVDHHVRFIYKPNAFLIILEAPFLSFCNFPGPSRFSFGRSWFCYQNSAAVRFFIKSFIKVFQMGLILLNAFWGVQRVPKVEKWRPKNTNFRQVL